MCLFSCRHHAALVAVTLWYSLKSGSEILLAPGRFGGCDFVVQSEVGSKILLAPCCFGGCDFVVQSEVRSEILPAPFFFFRITFGYSESFVFPYKLNTFFFQFCEKCHW